MKSITNSYEIVKSSSPTDSLTAQAGKRQVIRMFGLFSLSAFIVGLQPISSSAHQSFCFEPSALLGGVVAPSAKPKL